MRDVAKPTVCVVHCTGETDGSMRSVVIPTVCIAYCTWETDVSIQPSVSPVQCIIHTVGIATPLILPPVSPVQYSIHNADRMLCSRTDSTVQYCTVEIGGSMRGVVMPTVCIVYCTWETDGSI